MQIQPARVDEIRAKMAGSNATDGTTGPSGKAGSTDSLSKSGSVYGLSKDDFLKLFLAQLQNQDPTSPVDDKEFLGQLAQLTQIDTLQQVQKSLAGSELASASGMIGRSVTGLDVDGKSVDGVVTGVIQSVDAGLVLMVGTQAIKPENVITVASPTKSA